MGAYRPVPFPESAGEVASRDFVEARPRAELERTPGRPSLRGTLGPAMLRLSPPQIQVLYRVLTRPRRG